MRAFHEVRSYDGDFMVSCSPYTNISFLAHWHKEIELIYVKEGTADISVTDRSFTAKEGDLVICDSGDIHYSNSHNLENCLYFIIFDSSIISPIYQYSFFDNPLISREMLINTSLEKPLKMLIETLTDELSMKKPYYQDIVKAKIREFWYRLKRNLKKADETILGNNKRLEIMYDLRQLLEYIENHYTEDITLNFAAEKMNFSESHFSKVFKKLMGINFVTYLNVVRIEKATVLLKTTPKKVIDVAMSCGYNNIRTFNRTFKEITGYTPLKFVSSADPDMYKTTYYTRQT